MASLCHRCSSTWEIDDYETMASSEDNAIGTTISCCSPEHSGSIYEVCWAVWTFSARRSVIRDMIFFALDTARQAYGLDLSDTELIH